MATFKAGEHEYTLALTVGALKRVRDALQYDLAKALSPLGMGQLLDDPVRFVNVLYVLVREQCEQRGVTDEQFGESLYGDALWGAIKAFEECLISFCPSPSQRAALAAWRDRGELRIEEAAKRAIEAAQDGTLDKAIDSALRSRTSPPASSGPASTNEPESSDSAPTPTPCANSSG